MYIKESPYPGYFVSKDGDVFSNRHVSGKLPYLKKLRPGKSNYLKVAIFDGMNRHGTQVFGEKANSSKLNEFQVRIIRRIQGLQQREIAKVFSMSQYAIASILQRKHWKHI